MTTRFTGPVASDNGFSIGKGDDLTSVIDSDGMVVSGVKYISKELDIVILFGTAAPTDGTSGTGAGVAGPSSVYIRQSAGNNTWFINENTKASPTWKAIDTAA